MASPTRTRLLPVVAFQLAAIAHASLFPWLPLGPMRAGGGLWQPGADAGGSGLVYLVFLGLWTRARRREARAGMAPGVGIGGIALVRPQRDPRTTPLGHERFGPARPPDVVFLHGLGTSGREWEPVAAALGAKGLSALVPDLLGFGRSRRIGTSFGLDEHVDALLRLLERTRAPSTVVVGHSFGCAVAAALAETAPDRVRALVLVAPPAFHDRAAAARRIAARGWLERKVVEDSPLARIACGAMCLGRPLLSRALPRLVRHAPSALVREAVEHSWPPYRAAVRTLLDHNPLPAALARPLRPTSAIVGEQDELTPASDILDQRCEQVRVIALPGDHWLPLTHAHELARIIAAEGSALPRRRPDAAAPALRAG